MTQTSKFISRQTVVVRILTRNVFQQKAPKEWILFYMVHARIATDIHKIAHINYTIITGSASIRGIGAKKIHIFDCG